MVAPLAQKPFTSNIYINGILFGGKYWDQSENGGVIEYSFWNSGTEDFDDIYGDTATLAYDWFDYEKAAMEQALQLWANVANINFVQSDDDDINATLGFYSVDSVDLGPTGLGMFFPPNYTIEDGAGIGYFNWDIEPWSFYGLQQGAYGFITLIHELGHGLGLAHPHDDGGGSPLYPGVSNSADSGDFGLNQGVWTTMSYVDGLESNDLPYNTHYGYQGTPMAFDIAAIQYLYGANMSYKTGNNTYYLPQFNQIGTFYSCLWDAGGIDRISNAGSNRACIIDLNPAPLVGPNAGGFISSANGIYGGFTIANGVVIENATGGNKNDQIIGNSFQNNLNGGNGNDTVDGGNGNDTVDGGGGNDLIYLGDGNDYVDITSLGNDTIFGGNGNDYIYGYIGNEVYYGEAGNDTLIGYDGNDILNGGNGNDTVDGGNGNDTVDGGSGNDTVDGGSGNDTVDGGNGNDLIYLGDGNDYVDITSLGNDTIFGGNGNDYIYGYTGKEDYYGEAGNDTLIGYDGNDMLNGGQGSDRMNGGDGTDYFDYRKLTDSLLSNRDVIQDFDATNTGDYFWVAVERTSFQNLGSVSSLNAVAIGSLLTNSSFKAHGAASFTFGTKTFIAINNGISGYQQNQDAIVEITGFTGNLGLDDFTI